MMLPIKNLLCAGVLVLIPWQVLAQTPAGHEVDVSVSGYTYVEPRPMRISIQAPKIGGEYNGTLVLSKSKHWYAQADVRGIIGNTTYEGWCSPWQIKPNSSSPNGYELDFGDASACSETADQDWYVEARGLLGKDFIRGTWTFSPYTGLGFRHLSNGTTGAAGFRTDKYLYPPFGLAARTTVASHPLIFTVEYDYLIHGWQTTRNSLLGGGEVPATPIAPAFTIEGITDVSFDQHSGYSARVSGKYQVTNRWSVEPYFIHWSVNASPPSDETVTYTVNRVTAREQLGFYEPFNTTNEFGAKLGFRF